MSDYADKKRMDRLEDRVTALESPAAAPDPMCQCGHPKSKHDEVNYGGVCTATISGDEDYCPCFGFTEPPATPAPEIVECPACGEMVDDATLVVSVWEGEPHCNCPTEYDKIAAAAPDPVCATCGHIRDDHWNGLSCWSGCEHGCKRFVAISKDKGDDND